MILNTYSEKRIVAMRECIVCWMSVLAIFVSEQRSVAQNTPGRSESKAPEKINFNLHIRPILVQRCFPCHGPDKEKEKPPLRLDRQESVFAPSQKGTRIVVPGSPETSELWIRVMHSDASKRMPPSESDSQLTPDQLMLLRLWIEQGAVWGDHWSFARLERPDVPVVKDESWVSGEIDRFVLARMEPFKITPSSEADRVTLIRRLSFDLTGLPPGSRAVQDFVSDRHPMAYEKLVDRLIASLHFGERMAIHWLDLVRYADSVGYHGDQERSVSPYRDYVINAFNDDLPFDQFTVEQIAGDLLPRATVQQKVASGYNMLGMTSIEGGVQPEEYLAKYAADRVRTTSLVWMGATLGCAECHDHKFDPYTTRDFYRFAAFFSDIQQKGNGNPEGNLNVPFKEQSKLLVQQEEMVETLKSRIEETGELEKLKLVEELKRLTENQNRLNKMIRQTISPVSGEPRITRVLERGDWMDQSGEVVLPGVPDFMGGSLDGNRRLSRIDLSRWLVSRDHPQTARVWINRLWRLFYGRGLSPIMDDTGLQGGWPTHLALLDWLAVELIESGWDVKHIVRLMVTSRSYRQTSNPPVESKLADPENRWFSRQSRFRIEAELIRDNALAVSGLLVKTIGGNSIKPYQPEGYYSYLNFPKRVYQTSSGVSQYKRGLYMHWQRTFLHPMLLAFDAPSREQCVAQRPISNTPLAALTLLNDPTFVESARSLAVRVIQEGGAADRDRVAWLYVHVLSRNPDQRESEVLRNLVRVHRGHYDKNPQEADRLLVIGNYRVPSSLNRMEVAAWISACRVVLNLNETIMRN